MEIGHVAADSGLELHEVLEATLATENESLAIAMATSLTGSSVETLLELGPWAAVLGSGGAWLGPWRCAELFVRSVDARVDAAPTYAGRLPYEDKSIGLVVWLEPATGSLPRPQVLGEIARVLRPGGVLLAAACSASQGGQETKVESFLDLARHINTAAELIGDRSDPELAADQGGPPVPAAPELCPPCLRVRRRYHTNSNEGWCIAAENLPAGELSEDGGGLASARLPKPPPSELPPSELPSELPAGPPAGTPLGLSDRALECSAAAAAARRRRRSTEQTAADEARREWSASGFFKGPVLGVPAPAVHGQPLASGDRALGGSDLPPLPNFHAWRDLFPELQILLDNFGEIQREALEAVETGWKDWPEEHYSDGGAQDWKVFPFAHTFPADDPARTKFIESTCAACPNTAGLLKSLGPLVRTALFSRLGPGARISSHRGWADLANHVLRCHLGLKIPHGQACAVWCEGEVECHAEKDFIVFDDSKNHKAYNETSETRLVLIIDLARPDGMPKGRAHGGRTPELDNLIEYFS
mmetsp:Transcript_21895/g.49501  ORF Transcript_21895/g.49501 Transcript_21895/m.49501 type:complete len:531 (+) Transcript_21895:20-1612(+)